MEHNVYGSEDQKDLQKETLDVPEVSFCSLHSFQFFFPVCCFGNGLSGCSVFGRSLLRYVFFRHAVSHAVFISGLSPEYFLRDRQTVSMKGLRPDPHPLCGVLLPG